MAVSKTMHGARAIIWAGSTPLGIFNQCSYGRNYDITPVYLIGRVTAAELVYTGAEVITVSCSGFRVMGHGPFASVDPTGNGLVPKLQNILNTEDITLSLHDRLEPDPDKGTIMVLTNVKAQGFQSSVSARSIQDLALTFMGIHLSDESGAQEEAPGAVDLPATE